MPAGNVTKAGRSLTRSSKALLGRPVSADRLGERLRQLGLRTGQARSTALFQLATELPAAVLARLLGIHIKVAVAWQHVSAGDWASYAADVSRRLEH